MPKIQVHFKIYRKRAFEKQGLNLDKINVIKQLRNLL